MQTSPSTPSPRHDVEFRTEDGTVLNGWHYRPNGGTGSPAPLVVLANGVSGTRDKWMDRFATAFCADGLNVLVYDPRGFGTSGGRVRQEIVPDQLVDDVRDAISFAARLPGVDGSRIGVWGSSYGGGVMIQAGALDARIGCVAVQVPFVSGSALWRHVPPAEQQRMLQWFAGDRAARAAGAPPMTLQVVSQDPQATPCLLATQEAWDFSMDIARDTPDWKNEITVRSLELTFTFDPMVAIERLDKPFLCIAGKRDTLIPFALVSAAFERAPGPKELMALDMGHFEPYDLQFDRTSAAARDWFVRHLAS